MNLLHEPPTVIYSQVFFFARASEGFDLVDFINRIPLQDKGDNSRRLISADSTDELVVSKV